MRVLFGSATITIIDTVPLSSHPLKVDLGVHAESGRCHAPISSPPAGNGAAGQRDGSVSNEQCRTLARPKRSLHLPFELVADHRCLLWPAAEQFRGGTVGARSGPADGDFLGDRGTRRGIPDVDVLNYALTLEYLEATFYTQGLGGAGTTGVPASGATFSRRDITSSSVLDGFGRRIRRSAYSELIKIRDHEVEHVDFLRGALGGAAVGPCTFNFSSALRNVGSFLGTAHVLERTGVMAYDGAIRYVDAGANLQAGAQIATVEARHAAYLNLITGAPPFPSSFDQGKKPSEIFAKAKPFIVSCPAQVTALFGRLP